jgi:hypothetical protein
VNFSSQKNYFAKKFNEKCLLRGCCKKARADEKYTEYYSTFLKSFQGSRLEIPAIGWPLSKVNAPV